MLDALFISAVGLQAQKEQLDAAAINFANAGTPAYKRQAVDFAALLDRAPRGQSIGATPDAQAQPLRALRTDLTAGEIRATGRLLDIAIAGPGFLEVELADGRSGYSRNGALRIDAQGQLTLASGLPLKADVRVPTGASDVQILADGRVTARLSGDVVPTALGQLELALFDDPEALQYHGEGVFTLPETSNEPLRQRPGEEGAGVLAAQSLEGSNVRLVDEMVSLLLTQRVYELNSRVVQAADELMGMTNNLRRG